MEHIRKWKRIIYILSIFVIEISLFSKGTFFVCAANTEEITLEGLTKEDARLRLSQASLRSGSMDALISANFKEILVTDDWIAVGNEENVVGVFDCEGQMKYCVRFTTTGIYSLYYDDNIDSLVIKIVRNDTYYTFDINGKLCRMSARKSHYAETLSGTSEKDELGNQYYLETERQASSLFLKKRTSVIKKGEEESNFLKSDFRYDNQMFIYILIAVAAILTGILHSENLLHSHFNNRKEK